MSIHLGLCLLPATYPILPNKLLKPLMLWFLSICKVGVIYPLHNVGGFYDIAHIKHLTRDKNSLNIDHH